MDIQLTDDGLKALTENKSLTMVKFIAGSSLDLQSMRTYFSSNNYTGPYSYYQYDVDSSRTYLKGDTYTKPDGTNVTCTENFLEVIGSLDCRNVSSNFTMRSLGIVAQSGSSSSSRFIYAFGALSSQDTPYPVNRNEAITYITPARIIYNSSSSVTLEDPHVPWKNFIEHTDTSVNSEDGAHGLKINPDTREMTVGGTTITLFSGGERIDELERQMQGVLKYRASAGAREYNSEWVRRITGSGTSGDPWRIYTPYDLNLLRTEEFNQGQGYFSLENNIDLTYAIGIRAEVTDEGYTVDTFDPDAPCFNHGFGWEPLRLHGGHFEGNHHWIKGLFLGPVDVPNFSSYYPEIPYGYSQRDYLEQRGGLFMRLAQYSTLNGLNMEDSAILGGNAGYDTRIGSLCAQCYSGSSITNCCSHADIVYTIGNRFMYLGGICGIFLGGSGGMIAYNAFHGTLNKFSGQMIQGYVGSISTEGTQDYSYGNYSDADIKFGDARGGIHAATNFGLPWRSNYYTGRVYPRPGYTDNPDYLGSINSGRGGKYRLDAMRYTRYCYSLEGSAPANCMQGTVCSEEFMKSRDFVNLLNAALPEPRFIYHEGSFPRLDYEEESVPYTSPIASIDTSSNYVYDSGYTTQILSSMASNADVASMTASLSSEVQAKSIVKCADVTIRTTDWGNPGWDSKTFYWYNSLVDFDLYNKATVIPQAGDVLSCGIYANAVYFNQDESHAAMPGYIEFKCSTLPENDVTFRVIVVQNTTDQY